MRDPDGGPPGATDSRIARAARRITGLLILLIGLATVAGSVAVILGLVGGASSTWRQVFRAMGGVLAAVSSTAFALGGVSLMTGSARLRMFTAWAGVQGMAMGMGCFIASLLLEGPRQLGLAGAGLLIGALAVHALSETVFRGARWNAAPWNEESS